MKTIKIEGMHCPNCSARVKNALIALGVSVNVELETGEAIVDGSNMPEDGVLRATIEDLGFNVAEIR